MIGLSRIPLISGGELTPMQMVRADVLESWHESSRGYTLGAQLRPDGTSPPAPFGISGNLVQSVGLVIKTSAGARGIATYDAFIDGGTTPIQSGITGASVALTLLAVTAAFPIGTYSADNVYTGVCGQWANQTAKTRTLVSNGILTQSPVIEWNALKGRPAVKSLGTNQPHLFDSTSDWATQLSGDRTWMFVGKTADASPSSVRTFLGLGNSGDVDSLWSVETRGPSHMAWQVTKVGDSGVSDIALAADNTLDTSWHVFTVTMVGDTVSVYIDGVLSFTDSLSGAGSATFDTVAFFARRRGGLANSSIIGSITEELSWSAALTTSERQEHEARLRLKWII